MKFHTGLTAIGAIIAFAGSGHAAQITLSPSMPSITPVQSSGSFSVTPQLQIAARLFTPAVPSGFTCEATAHFANNTPLRCVVGTGGNVTTLRGGITTSTNGAFPLTSPANLTVPAQ